ncbi:MAG TPA: FHA domain-containing protein [Blastocatellia bacterium]|jgi:hypothetical protein|nr:FHA domain-containing protein [Blastocatellia bacterium]
MSNARLIVQAPDKSPTEHEVTNSISVGSAADNQVRLSDRGVAPYHAIIVRVKDSYLISDIGNSGSFVNGAQIQTNHPLRDGDLISIGEAAQIRFLMPAEEVQSAEVAPSLSSPNAGESAAASGVSEGALSSGTAESAQRSQAVGGNSSETFSWLHIALAFTIGLSMVGVVALGYYLFRPEGPNVNGKNCGVARIINPAAGTIVSRATTISVMADNPECIRRISYLLDGQPFASSEAGVFEAVLDPIKLREQSPRLATGSHELSVVVEGAGLRRESEAVQITLDVPGGGIDLGFIREKAEALAGLLSGANGGDFVFETEFIERIRTQTSEFRTDFYPAAEQHKFEINPTFRNDAGLSELFGYLLALSRSRFVAGAGVNGCGVDPDGVGLWRLSQRIVRQYPNKCGDSNQEVCIAATHFNELLGIFDGPEGFMYAVACFGESSDRAGKILDRLPDANQRRNFWASARTGSMTQDEVSRVVCFMAAGVVAQNPKPFGINSQSLSSRVK